MIIPDYLRYTRDHLWTQENYIQSDALFSTTDYLYLSVNKL